MAFILKNFQPIGATARAGAPTSASINSAQLWSYANAGDNLVAVRTAGYFNFVRDIVQVNDAILLTQSNVASGNSDWEVAFFATVPKSPATGNVVLSGKQMVA